jgi:hypothetical protein
MLSAIQKSSQAGPRHPLPFCRHPFRSGAVTCVWRPEYGQQTDSRCRGLPPTRPLDYWSTCKQCMVGGWFWGTTRCEPDDLAVLHQLQSEEGLVSRDATDSNRELASHELGPLDCSIRGRRGRVMRLGAQPVKHSAWFLRECCTPRQCFAVEYASDVCAFVPEKVTHLTCKLGGRGDNCR